MVERFLSFVLQYLAAVADVGIGIFSDVSDRSFSIQSINLENLLRGDGRGYNKGSQELPSLRLG